MAQSSAALMRKEPDVRQDESASGRGLRAHALACRSSAISEKSGCHGDEE